MADPYLIVAVPCRDAIRGTAYAGLIGAVMRAQQFWKETVGSSRFGYFVMSGVQAAEARTELWKKAYEVGADWIWWIDDDVFPPLDAFEQMYRATPMGDIVSGFYWRKAPPFKSVIGRFPIGGGVEWIDPSDMTMPYEEVHAIGFGCCLMKRKVIDHVALECNDQPFLTKPGQTEDVYFGNAARRHGYKIIAVRDLHCKHVGDYQFSYDDRKAWLAANHAEQKQEAITA